MKKRIAIPLALAVIFLSACNNRVASQADLLPTEKQQTRTCSRCGAAESQSIPKVEAPALE